MRNLCWTDLVLVLVVSGCSWVELTPQGEQVKFYKVKPVSCKELSTVTAKTMHRVVLDRSSETVGNELLALARNEAGKQGANGISPVSPIVDGEQVFKVYRCGK